MFVLDYHKLLCWGQCRFWDTITWGGEGGGGGLVANAKCEAQAQILDMLQTWPSDLSPSQSHWERKSEKKVTVTQARGPNPQPGKWAAMLYITNWATESLGNSAGELEYLRLSFCIVKVGGAARESLEESSPSQPPIKPPLSEGVHKSIDTTIYAQRILLSWKYLPWIANEK